MMANENATSKIGIEDIVHATTQGVLRALDARGTAVSAAELVRSGFAIDVMIRAGGFPGLAQNLSNARALNPQPEPPGISSIAKGGVDSGG